MIDFVEPSPDRGLRRSWILALVLIACASWPWYQGLSVPPMAADAPELLGRADPAGEGWLEYALSSPHFGVAWRPLTVLSFSLDRALGGLSLGMLRGTDLVLHFAAALGVFALGLRLAGDRKVAWVALALYLAHPLLDDIVPFLPRRCYTLCAALCLPAMAIALDPRPTWGRGLLAGLLFALGLASHEIASFFMFGTLAFSLAQDWGKPVGERVGRATLRLLPGSILAALLLIARGVVLGRIGGYDTKGRALALVELLELLGQGMFSVSGIWALTGLAALAGLCLARGFTGGREGRALGWAFCAWLLVAEGILGAQGVWFPRIAYSMLPIMALALAWLVTQDGSARVLRVGALLVCLPFLFASPLLRGPNSVREQLREARADLIEDLEGAADKVLSLTDQPTVLRLVLPFYRDKGTVRGRGQSAGRLLPRDARQPWRWVNLQLDEERLVLEPWLYIEELDHAWDAKIQIMEAAPTLQLELPLEREILRMGVSTPRRRKPLAGPRETWRPSRAYRQRRQFLFVYGPEGGELIEP